MGLGEEKNKLQLIRLSRVRIVVHEKQKKILRIYVQVDGVSEKDSPGNKARPYEANVTLKRAKQPG